MDNTQPGPLAIFEAEVTQHKEQKSALTLKLDTATNEILQLKNSLASSSRYTLSHHLQCQVLTARLAAEKQERQQLAVRVADQGVLLNQLEGRVHSGGRWEWVHGVGAVEGRFNWVRRSTGQQPSAIPKISAEVRFNIADFLPKKDRYNLALVSKSWLEAVAKGLYGCPELTQRKLASFLAVKRYYAEVEPEPGTLHDYIRIHDISIHGGLAGEADPLSGEFDAARPVLPIPATHVLKVKSVSLEECDAELSDFLDWWYPFLAMLDPVTVRFKGNPTSTLPTWDVVSPSAYSFAQYWYRLRFATFSGNNSVPFLEGTVDKLALRPGRTDPRRFRFKNFEGSYLGIRGPSFEGDWFIPTKPRDLKAFLEGGVESDDDSDSDVREGDSELLAEWYR